jgi:transcriptional regulator with XRE-family HTH domain
VPTRPAPTRQSLGAALRSLREARETTQETVALKARMTQAFVSDGEAGRRNLSFETLERWLRALGVSWAEFGAAVDRATRLR